MEILFWIFVICWVVCVIGWIVAIVRRDDNSLYWVIALDIFAFMIVLLNLIIKSIG